MRVIAGVHKGRALRPVPTKSTRPTTDKVKEALFHMIGPYFEGGTFLDLFAGSGGLGIEALSRGMNLGIFVDKHPKAISTIRENVKTLKLDDQVEIYRNEAFKALKAVSKRDIAFDLIILDPPYGKVSFEELFESIENYNLLKEDGLVVCEHTSEQTLSETYGPFEQVRAETYSNIISVSLYRRNQEA
ncbi:rRNA methyltransferase [Pontibacillus halophilus JSM 076056 = DSM 19796]|uniref:rRNA methyltransferase n=1 Tax=Pontibacillus halophilus JSM 076056 = DSM 19796 TaxID=1385510 RepID=A0A0A5GPV3_9BACI|nr:16S rRNA (guanine(966)-N(2))-methyltransferase RsmD [Pontibacillus halophilus]KGX93283.1 rRNA methyltransferase [Pontibacillus halophilus JSM 076056 = DSM 19796]